MTEKELTKENQKTTTTATATATATQIGGSHYEKLAIQPIDFIMQNNLNFAEGNIIKYVLRYKLKNGIEDLRKARHYIDILIENYEEK